jgi:two-component system chemotaxis response regulator CheY
MAQKKVIIIDDSKYVVDKLQQFFGEYLKFTVAATANDGAYALELYKRHKPDLVTLDIMMPNMDGISALKELLKYDPGANVLMVSAVRGDSMLRCMVLGAKGYVEKPVKLHDNAFVKDFTDTVHEILGQF